jgi:TetR/AcrR family fatty acid metabolism transcriptional regulator
MDTAVPRRSLRERQRQEREELILQAAEEVLVEKGYNNTSMDEIAQRVGVAKGTVYLHFPSKEALLLALLKRDVQRLLQVVTATEGKTTSVCAQLEAILRYVYEKLLSQRFQILYALYESVTERQILLDQKEHFLAQWQQLSAHITALIEKGKAAGELDASIPTIVLSNAFFTLLSPISYKRLTVEEHIQPGELVEHLIRIYFHGVAADKNE